VIIFTKPQLKSVYDFRFVVLFYCIFDLTPALHNIFHTPMAQYNLFVLKVSLNTNQSTDLMNSACLTVV